MKIKICGLKSADDAKYLNIADVDYGGFIFAEKSRRKIDIETAKAIRKVLKPQILSVGVFVNQSYDFILKTLNIIDCIQLHGDENNDFIKKLQTESGKKIIKAFRADDNLERNLNNTCADFVLIDSAKGNSFGGTGTVFDWNLVPDTDKKIFLAGGLNSQNIIDAIHSVKPYCVDINSGAEVNGNKDLNKIIEITKIIRGLKS